MKYANTTDVKVRDVNSEGVKEYDFGYAKVIVHPSKMSPEEQRRVYEEAARKLLRAVQKAHKDKKI